MSPTDRAAVAPDGGGLSGRRPGGVSGGGGEQGGSPSRQGFDSCLVKKGLGGRAKEVLDEKELGIIEC